MDFGLSRGIQRQPGLCRAWSYQSQEGLCPPHLALFCCIQLSLQTRDLLFSVYMIDGRWLLSPPKSVPLGSSK